VVLIVFRSALFVFKPQLALPRTRPCIGLMAKDITEDGPFRCDVRPELHARRGSVGGAPLFALFGPSMTALKLPLLG
jgi:hypothetical protein